MTRTEAREVGSPTEHAGRRRRILFLTDDLYHHTASGDFVPEAGDITYLINAVADHAGTREVVLVAPANEAARLPHRPAERWSPRLRFVPLRPSSSMSGYLLTAPLHIARNGPLLWRSLRTSDEVWIRIPAMNSFLLHLLARVRRLPITYFVVGDSRAVVESCEDSGRVIRLLARRYWDLALRLAAGHRCLAFGTPLADSLRRRGARQVSGYFTSLVRPTDIASESRSSLPGPGVDLVYMGRLAKEKGLLDLLAAHRLLRSAGVEARLTIVGDGPLLGDLKERAGTAVTFTGYVADWETQTRILDQADLFVFPSYSEGVPKVLLRAAARALPVVASNVGGIPDVVHDGRTGVLVEPGQPAALADAIRHLADDPDTYRSMSSASLAWVADHTLPRKVEELLSITAPDRT